MASRTGLLPRNENDTFDIIGITEFEPGKNFTLVASHNDGTKDEIPVAHTLNEMQFEWFKAGSALNLIKQQTN